MSALLNKAEEWKWRQAFDLFDVQGQGKISLQELRDVVEELCLEEGNQKAYQRLKENIAATHRKVGEEENYLNFEDFVKLWTKSHNEHEDMIARAFTLMDVDEKGYIDRNDLQRISQELGESLQEDELVDMMQQKERVSLDDFRTIMTRKLFSEI